MSRFTLHLNRGLSFAFFTMIMRNSTDSMPSCPETALHVLQTEFADPEPALGYIGILLGEGRIKPCLYVKEPETDSPDSEAGRLG